MKVANDLGNSDWRGVELIWSQATAWWPYPNIDLLIGSRIILQTYVHQYVLTIWLVRYFHSTSSYKHTSISFPSHTHPTLITWTPTALWLWIPCCIKASSLVERTTPQPIPSGSWTISLLHLDPRHDCLGQITCGGRKIHVTCAGFKVEGPKYCYMLFGRWCLSLNTSPGPADSYFFLKLSCSRNGESVGTTQTANSFLKAAACSLSPEKSSRIELDT